MKTLIWIPVFVLLLLANTSYSQNFAAKKATLQKVFDNIVNAYGNVKAPPSLQLISKNNSAGYPASYISTPVPTVTIEERVVDICKQMGQDSLNALAIILSHELAHYYNDHTWCSDYSYAMRNTNLGQKLKSLTKEDQLKYEIQADNNCFYYSCVAGYAPFGIYSKLIDRIYSAYKLPATVSGYPGKEERKMISRGAQEKIKQLYPVYDAGLLLLYLNELTAAESCYDYLAKYFPSREIYNNLGIAKFLAGVAVMPYNAMNFIYPVDIDPVSRIYQGGTRGDDESTAYISILRDAKKQFEKAISLDPSYINSYINLACVNDALGNYQMALGNIHEAEQLTTNDPVKQKHIKAIVQYHTGNKDTAETLLRTIANQDSIAAFNYRLLTLAKSTRNDIVLLEKFKDDFAASLINKTSTEKGCNPIPNIILKGKKSTTKINDKLTITSEMADSYSQIRIKLPGKLIDAKITWGREMASEINSGNFRVINSHYGCLVFADSFVKNIGFKID